MKVGVDPISHPPFSSLFCLVLISYLSIYLLPILSPTLSYRAIEHYHFLTFPLFGADLRAHKHQIVPLLGKMLLNVSVLRLFAVQPMLSSCTGKKLLHSSLLFLCFGSSHHRLCYQAVPVLSLLHSSVTS